MMPNLKRLTILCLMATAAVDCWAQQANGSADGLEVTPQKGQSADQQRRDRYECYRWAVGQTGFDPTQPRGGLTPDRVVAGRSNYQRAMAACLQARDYLVRAVPEYNPPYPSPPVYGSNPYGPPVRYVIPAAPTLTTEPVTGTVSGGIGFPTGNASDLLGVGARFGLGVTWFPSPVAPLGLRLEGSYSWYGAHNHYYYNYYAHGDTDLYGADIDLELNLKHQRDSRLYLIGGLGEYRATFYRNQYAFTCGFYNCGPGYLGTTGSATTDWHGAWNLGLGWEFALSPESALYIEARYMQLIPSDIHLEFVPVTVGYRF